MKKIYSILVALMTTILCATNTNAAPTIVDYTASAEEGIVVTFSEPVKLTNNGFDISIGYCATLTEGSSSDGIAIKVSGSGTNKATIKRQFGTFVNGNSYKLVFKPTHVVSLANGEQLTGNTTLEFVMGAGKPVADVQVQNFTPAAGDRTTLDNVTSEFTKKIVEIVEEGMVEIYNENFHSLKLSTVGLDSENPFGAININIAEDQALEEGTTYKCHIGIGAIKFEDGSVNKSEIVFGAWYIPIKPLALTLNPAANSVVESLSEVTITCNKDMTFVGKASDITITGIMEYQVNTYATCTSVVKQNDGSFLLTFDKEVTPEMLDEVEVIPSTGADRNNVKINIPELSFMSGSASNRTTQAIYIVKKNIALGEITWTFNPAEDSEVEVLGVPFQIEDENGVKTHYSISFSITEENNNLWVSIPDASSIKIYDSTGKAVKSFSQYDITGGTDNRFSLDLSTNPLMATGPAAKTGIFTLIIPADAVFYYTDANHYGEPTHPEKDIEVSWTLKEGAGIPDAISNIAAKNSQNVYSLQGIKLQSAAQKGLYIVNGKKFVK